MTLTAQIETNEELYTRITVRDTEQDNAVVDIAEGPDHIVRGIMQRQYDDIDLRSCITISAQIDTDQHVNAMWSIWWKAPTECVVTSALREGDTIRNNGCLMRINEVHERKDPALHHPSGVYHYSLATVLHRADSTIPMGWFHRGECGERRWVVQGNDNAEWHRIIR